MADPSSGETYGSAPPTVSVLLPVIDAMEYLRPTIDSIVRQKLQPAEVIFIDDGSTDGTQEFIESIELPFHKQVLYQKAGFQSAARNLAATHASGTYLAFIDHDDVWYPQHLEQLVALLEANPLLGWAYSDMNEMDKDGGLIATRIIRHLNPAAEHPKTNIINMMSSDMFVFPSAAVVRRDAFLQIGGFDERLSGYEDDDLFLRMFRAGWLNAFNPEATICYRRHFGSSAFSERMWLSREIFAEKLCDAYPDEPELVRFYIRDVIGPRFYSHAREEYWRHFPHRRWDLCMRSLELMRRFSAMSEPSLRNRLRRSIGFRILARPALFEHLYPLLRLLIPLPRFVMRPRSSASPEHLEKRPSSEAH
jgi:glycosyltransferase involved in cell wall biosynthesis